LSSKPEKDVFEKHQAIIDAVKDAALKFDVFGNVKEKLPCDDMSTFHIDDCKTCSNPCNDDSETALSGKPDE
jgi:hypothetical protein